MHHADLAAANQQASICMLGNAHGLHTLLAELLA